MYALDCLFLVTWTALAFAVGLYWYRKGRSMPAGFWLSMLCTPPVSLALGACLPVEPLRRAQRLAPGGRLRYCPWCHALMALGARVCPACYHAVPPHAEPAADTAWPAGAAGTLAHPAPAAAEFSVGLDTSRGTARWLVREVDPVALAVVAIRPELAQHPALKTLSPAAVFPLDLALYLARQRRGRSPHRTAPIRVAFLDGVVEEFL